MVRDHLVKATAAGGRIRAVAIRSTDLAEEARCRHDLSPTAAAAMGKAMTGTLLLAATLRKSGRLNMRLVGGGPLGGIFVDAGTDGTVRGYVGNPAVELAPRPDGHLDVGGAVGRDGFLSVTYDLGRRPYTGTVALTSGEVADDITAYLAHSEQIPSAVSLGIYVDHGRVVSAGGLLVQLLPEAGDEIAERLEQAIRALPSFSEMDQAHLSLVQVLERALEGFAVEILQEDLGVRFACHCDLERVLNALRMLGAEELQDMIATDGCAEVRCHFCGQRYQVSREQLEALIS
ncbi:MAG: Hsp33 family molecular chaperone HslO [Candidatus Sericytochromatia bacterium]|nr:Hsp33 family molecular chaperone HslO [Candidatus Sericytochromatia bacterium]